MPKQFQRTQGLKTGINVGAAQVFKNDTPKYLQARQAHDLQKEQLDYKKKQAKAKALEAEMELQKKYAIPESGYLIAGNNTREKELTDVIILQKGKVDWSDPNSVREFDDMFTKYKTELSILSERDKIAQGLVNSMDTGAYHGEEDLSKLILSEEYNPNQMEIMMAVNKQTPLLDIINKSANSLGTTLTDIETGEKSEKWKMARENDIAAVSKAKYNELLVSNPQDMDAQGWDDFAKFDKQFRSNLDVEHVVDLDEDSKKTYFDGGFKTKNFTFSYNTVSDKKLVDPNNPEAGVEGSDKYEEIRIARNDKAENDVYKVTDPSDTNKMIDFQPITVRRYGDKDDWVAVGDKQTPVTELIGGDMYYKLVDSEEKILTSEYDPKKHEIEKRIDQTEIPYNLIKHHVEANFGGETITDIVESVKKFEGYTGTGESTESSKENKDPLSIF